jgi:ribosomal protein S25
LSESKTGKKGKVKAEEAKKSSRGRGGLSLSLDEGSILKELGKMRAITPFSVASQFDLKVSAAKVLLRRLAEKGVIEAVGGGSRIRIYKVKAD